MMALYCSCSKDKKTAPYCYSRRWAESGGESRTPAFDKQQEIIEKEVLPLFQQEQKGY